MKFCGTSANLLLFTIYFSLDLTAPVPLCSIYYDSNVL